MSEKKRIIIVSELFYPEELSTAHIMSRIARYLSSSFKVLVIAGPKSYEGEEKRLSAIDEGFDAIEIERVWVPNLNKNHLGSRVARFGILCVSLAWTVFARTKRRDIVFAVTNPAPLLLFLAIIRKVKGMPLVFLVHDIFPENAVAAGMVNERSAAYKMIRVLFNWAYGTADSIIAIGRDMSEIIARKIGSDNGRINIVENWADVVDVKASLFKKPIESNSMGEKTRIVILYAGNIGRAQGILEFVEAVSRVRNESLHYAFRGSGALSEALKAKVINVARFTVGDAYPRDEQMQVLESGDIGLIILGKSMYGLGVPSKAYNIMAVGKPILFLGPRNSEIYRVVRDNKIGWAFGWDQIEEMISFLNSISIGDAGVFREMGQRARALVEEAYSEELQLGKIRKIIQSL